MTLSVSRLDMPSEMARLRRGAAGRRSSIAILVWFSSVMGELRQRSGVQAVDTRVSVAVTTGFWRRTKREPNMFACLAGDEVLLVTETLVHDGVG